jgi:UDP:flavonoid glycosyltransferase YjiC (YdhE family)
MAEVDALRLRLGLPATARHPLFEGAYSPQGTFGLFDPVLMPRQEGLPANWHWAGFCHDDGTVQQPDRGLQDFLEAGAAPVVFTLGSSAVHYSQRFYEEAAKAVMNLGLRAVLLTGGHACKVKSPLIYETAWASHAALFPRARAVVHQGGMGTLSQALRAGVPQVVVPFGNDQPDNAARLQRLGVATTVRTWQISKSRLASALVKLLADGKCEADAKSLVPGVSRVCGAETVARLLTGPV